MMRHIHFLTILLALLFVMNCEKNTASFYSKTPGTKILYRSNADQMLHLLESDGSSDVSLARMLPVENAFEWFPDGSKIVYADEKDSSKNAASHFIILNDLQRKQQTVLREDPLYSFLNFFVFQNMSKILFCATRDIRLGVIGIINTDGSGFTLLPDHGMYCYHPVWSPLNNKIIFIGRDWGDSDIYSMNIDGTELQNLTNDPGFESAIALSPDCETLAFISYRNAITGLYTMELNGGGVRLLIEPDKATGYVVEPDWSPDGRQLTFIMKPSNTYQQQIFVIRKDGSGLKQISNENAYLGDPQWDPDGNRVYFSSNQDGLNLIRIDMSGENRQRILFVKSAGIWDFKVSPTSIAY